MRCGFFALLVLLKTINGLVVGTQQIHVQDGENKTIECSIGQTITILYAEYGNAGSGVNDHCGKTFNVTSRVSLFCGGKQYCSIAPNPNQFVRDPCPGVEKSVRVTYSCINGPSAIDPVRNITVYTSNSGLEDDKQTEEPSSMPATPTEEPVGIAELIDVWDGENKTIVCPGDHTIEILNAQYGQPGRKPSDDECRVTIQMTSNGAHCNGNPSCLISPNPDQFTVDPCPGVRKYVLVTYQCIDGYVAQQEHTTTAEEYTIIKDAYTDEPIRTKGTVTEETAGIEDMVNLSYKGLKEADLQENLINAITVNLSGNDIARLGKGIFIKIPNCQILDLSNNKIAVIEGGVFENLIYLKSLTLTGNPLEEISGDMWEGLWSLEVLQITNVSLTNIKPRGFDNLKSLKTITLNLNVLGKFKYLFMNRISFPDTPKNQVTFRIELGGREITCDNSFCFLNNMHEKGLIGGFSAQGKSIPELVCESDQSPFREYASLNCDSTNEKLPIKVNVNCENQLTFCFNSQNLSEFPTEKIYRNATTVQLSHNNIFTLQNNSFVGLSNLVTMILSKNCIENIVSGVFRAQGKLKHLDLGENNLTSINGEMWDGLSSLEILRITGNKLYNLSTHAFNNLPKLKLLAVGFALLLDQKQKLFDPNTFSNSTTQPQIALEQDNNTLVCNSSNCWLKEKEDQGLLVHYEKNGRPFRPKCSDQPGMYWDQVDLKCSDNTALIAPIVGGVVGSLIFLAFCAFFIKCMCERRRPKNEENPVYQGGGPRPPRGMPPPIIIHDMQALERRRNENLREARARVRKRLQEEAKQDEMRLDHPHPQRQSAQDHDQQHSVEVGVEVVAGARGYDAGCAQGSNQPDKCNDGAQCMDEQIMKNQAGKVLALKRMFEVPQEKQAYSKTRRYGVSAKTSAREGIYAQIDETQMVDFNPRTQQKDRIKRTVVNV